MGTLRWFPITPARIAVSSDSCLSTVNTKMEVLAVDMNVTSYFLQGFGSVLAMRLHFRRCIYFTTRNLKVFFYFGSGRFIDFRRFCHCFHPFSNSINIWSFQLINRKTCDLNFQINSKQESYWLYITERTTWPFPQTSITRHSFFVRSFDCVWFSHFQFVADFHTENSSLSHTCGRRIELKLKWKRIQ